MATAEQQKKGRDAKSLRVSLSENVDTLIASGDIWLATITEQILHKILASRKAKQDINLDFLTIRKVWD